MALVRCILIAFLLFSLDHFRSTQAENSTPSPVAMAPVFNQKGAAAEHPAGTGTVPAKARKLKGGGGSRGGGSGGSRGGGSGRGFGGRKMPPIVFVRVSSKSNTTSGAVPIDTHRSFGMIMALAASTMTVLLL